MIYLAYPFGIQPKPQWMGSFDPSTVYDPAIPLIEQVPKLQLGEQRVPELVMSAFGLPQEILMAPQESLLKWESPLCSEQTWRDIYFLVRSKVVVYAGDVSNLGDVTIDLAIAKLMSIPIVTVSDRVNIPPQIKYLSEVLVSSDPKKFLPIINFYSA